ncbi:hypothetical protein GCM10011414_27970 [Croceivirga lutea]|uniref:hypothetical protein n=1 Tax=Croceivirga lutea TaxID=1775167 RepID=UPI00163A0457|nr:hypothetical protein [Croceivirga lutea]GGG56538.1 hypothetical protein GCM10011414_27970 [Croceivirga lutea]
MKRFLPHIFFLLVGIVYGQTNRYTFSPRDVELHSVAGNLAAATGSELLCEFTGNQRLYRILGAIGGSAIAGLGKEVFDSRDGGTGWSNNDVLTTVIGGLSFTVNIELFNAAHTKKRPKQEGTALVVLDENMYSFRNLSNQELPALSSLAIPDLWD